MRQNNFPSDRYRFGTFALKRSPHHHNEAGKQRELPVDGNEAQKSGGCNGEVCNSFGDDMRKQKLDRFNIIGKSFLPRRFPSL